MFSPLQVLLGKHSTISDPVMTVPSVHSIFATLPTRFDPCCTIPASTLRVGHSPTIKDSLIIAFHSYTLYITEYCTVPDLGL